MTEPFNPLEKKNLAASVAEALLECTPHPLGSLPSFTGAGIYAIYFVGAATEEFDAYEPESARNRDNQFEWPIYVGKAIPQGARKGKANQSGKPGRELYDRLRDHAKSVIAATNLDIGDFYCRYLVVDDIWIPLGENLLISKFSPIWNRLIDGFGNHTPGSGRFEGMRPRWDVLHPGRAWADKCKPRLETRETIVSEVKTYLVSSVVPAAKPKLLAPD